MQLKKEYMTDLPDSVRREEIRESKIRTWSGLLIDPFRPEVNDIRIDDIAHALSLVCRYGGHIDFHYSVGQHSLYVYERVKETGITDPCCLLMALLHDAEEAYLGDMPSPLKHRYQKYVNDGIDLRTFIYDKFIPGWDMNRMWLDIVESADADLYVMERMSYFQSGSEARRTMMQKFGRTPLASHLTPKEIESKFLLEFARLSDGLPK